MAIPRNLSKLAQGADTSGVLAATKGGTGLTAPGTNGNVLTSNGTAWTSSAPAAQAYPGAGIANSTGTAWGTSYTTSGSGTVVALATSPTLNNPTITNYTESYFNIGTVTTSYTISLSNGTVQNASLTNATACNFVMPTATAGKSFVIIVRQALSGAGNGTATFGSGQVRWGTAGAPTISTGAGKTDIISFIADGSNWFGSIAQGYTP